jgi:hypothetical protein
VELLGPFVIAAGETKHFAKQGRYLEVITASDGLDILMLGSAGELADEMRGALSGFFAEAAFSQLQIKNRGAGAQTVVLMVSDGRGGSRRQPGVVEVVDGSKARTIAGLSFMSVGDGPATAGLSSLVQLRNLAASPYRMMLQGLWITCTAALNIHGGHSGFDYTAGPVAVKTKAQGALSLSHASIHGATGSANPVSSIASELFSIPFAAGQTLQVKFEDPVMLLPAQGFTLYTQGTNAGLVVTFEGFAEAV